MTPANRQIFISLPQRPEIASSWIKLSRVNLPGATWRLVDPIGNGIL